MEGSDQSLQSKLSQIAEASGGTLKFSVISIKELGLLVGATLSRTPNPIYQFEFDQNGFRQKAIAYTLTIDGSGRIATRCESFASAVVQSNGAIFKLNPFLLAYDYVGNQFMAVSALALFETFAREVARAPLKVSESANFSLTPNFKKGTVSLYGQVPNASIWKAKLDTSFSLESLIEGLHRLATETSAGDGRTVAVTATLKDRIERKAISSSPALTASSSTSPEVENIQVPDRVRSMIRRSICSSTAVILVGPPGTGKTALLRDAIAMFARDSFFTSQSSAKPDALWSTPDESWTARELVGGETVVDGEIRFAPGCVLRAILENRWLVLDETNRSDMDRIFGSLLTWLSGGTVELGRASSASDAPTIELGWELTSKDCRTVGVVNGELSGVDGKVKFLAGTGWRLLGTYNAIDAQRVFRFGAALGRRFARVPIPAAEPEVFARVLGSKIPQVPDLIRSRIVSLYSAHHVNVLTQLGPAVFLAIGRYISATVRENAIAEGALTPSMVQEAAQTNESLPPTALIEALAEGYVVNVGTWLAHLEPKDREELKGRTIKNSALSEPEWTWISTAIQSLA